MFLIYYTTQKAQQVFWVEKGILKREYYYTSASLYDYCYFLSLTYPLWNIYSYDISTIPRIVQNSLQFKPPLLETISSLVLLPNS